MTPERWREVDGLLQAALERCPSERSAFVAQACAGDEELRHEVESLLSFHGQAESFMEEPPYKEAAELLGDEQADSLAGRTLGRYRVERAIGRGGMGQVYLASDTHLGRRVALKLLPASFARDDERLRRFELEGRAASALSHPNIITIHEVGAAEGLRFIVTEYVEGRTLRELSAAGPLQPGEALEIAVQAAGALAAAHEAGIIHRDVKPENIMVRPDGYVKVLDFGLAKPTERMAAGGNSGGGEPAPLVRLSTRPGMVMGTAHYMSPEQARGLKVDPRTDVWSLGVVLYEMLAGLRPFEGETTADVLTAILSQEPEPLAARAPAELQKVISKALAKEREGRYASVREMLAELREARDELAFRARQELRPSSGGSLSASDAAAPVATAGAMRRSRFGLWAAPLAVVVVVAAFGAYQYLAARRAPAPPPAVKMSRVTASGKIWGAGVSRDGRRIAYSAGPGRQQGLWMMQPGTGSSAQLIPPAAEVVYWGITFSPDGEYVYYVMNVGSGPWELYRVPALGGTPKKLVTNIDSAVEFSPDGRQIAFVRMVNLKEVEEGALVVANADGTAERVVATRSAPASFFLAGIVRIGWSPDGEWIACPTLNTSYPSENKFEVVALGLKDGAERTLTRERWFHIQQVAWLSDGGLIFIGRDKATAGEQVWRLSYPEGEARRLTNDFSNYADLGVTADSSTVVTVQSDTLSNIWVAPAGDATHARQITDGRNDGFDGLSWTPDGRLVFVSKVGGDKDIWSIDADGGHRRRLTENVGADVLPAVSPDGRYVVFESRRGSEKNVWRMDVDGGNPVQLTHVADAAEPQCSPDGRWVYYRAIGPGVSSNLWRVPIEGGQPLRLNVGSAAFPLPSPDGRWLAYLYFDLQVNPPFGLAVAPAEGGPPVKRLALSHGHGSGAFRWTPDGRALAYLDERSQNVWSQPIDGSPPRQLTDFKTDQTFYFDFSRDGRALALARGTVTGDVVLITDFK